MTSFPNSIGNHEESIFTMVRETFRGRGRWLVVIGWIKMGLFVLIAALAGFEFFRSETTRSMIAWASIFVVASLGTSILFVLFWLDLNRGVLTRKLKRLELEIARLRAR